MYTEFPLGLEHVYTHGVQQSLGNADNTKRKLYDCVVHVVLLHEMGAQHTIHDLE